MTGQTPLPNGLICENHSFVELLSCSHKLWCDITKASLVIIELHIIVLGVHMFHISYQMLIICEMEDELVFLSVPYYLLMFSFIYSLANGHSIM